MMIQISPPRSATPIEAAIIRLYNPKTDNKKQVAAMLNYKRVRTVQKVIRKYKYLFINVSIQTH